MKIVFQNNFKYEIHNNYLCSSKNLMRAVDRKQGIDKCQPETAFKNISKLYALVILGINDLLQ